MPLQIKVSYDEYWDQDIEEFVPGTSKVLVLEHSLVSLSKWESKWHVPYIQDERQEAMNPKTPEQIIDYIRCMTLTQNVDPEIYNHLSTENVKAINEYINNPMTATFFSNKPKKSREIITSEVIYYWMVALQIPVEFQKWHLNRLLTLIRVCEEKQQKPQKMPKNKAMAQQRALNAQRRARGHTKG